MTLIDDLIRIAADCSKANWDSYGANPVNPKVLTAAMVVSDNLTWVPTSNGGLQLEAHAGGVDMELELAPGESGEVVVLYG